MRRCAALLMGWLAGMGYSYRAFATRCPGPSETCYCPAQLVDGWESTAAVFRGQLTNIAGNADVAQLTFDVSEVRLDTLGALEPGQLFELEGCVGTLRGLWDWQPPATGEEYVVAVGTPVLGWEGVAGCDGPRRFVYFLVQPDDQVPCPSSQHVALASSDVLTILAAEDCVTAAVSVGLGPTPLCPSNQYDDAGGCGCFPRVP